MNWDGREEREKNDFVVSMTVGPMFRWRHARFRPRYQADPNPGVGLVAPGELLGRSRHNPRMGGVTGCGFTSSSPNNAIEAANGDALKLISETGNAAVFYVT